MSVLESLYNTGILRLAADISRIGRLAAPDATATAVSRLCGSTVTVDICWDGSRVTDFAHEVQACALGQAAASVMACNVVGCGAEELRKVGAQMRRMLKDNGPPPAGKWADLALLEQVRDYRPRHSSTLLTFDAVEECLEKVAG